VNVRIVAGPHESPLFQDLDPARVLLGMPDRHDVHGPRFSDHVEDGVDDVHVQVVLELALDDPIGHAQAARVALVGVQVDTADARRSLGSQHGVGVGLLVLELLPVPRQVTFVVLSRRFGRRPATPLKRRAQVLDAVLCCQEIQRVEARLERHQTHA